MLIVPFVLYSPIFYGFQEEDTMLNYKITLGRLDFQKRLNTPGANFRILGCVLAEQSSRTSKFQLLALLLKKLFYN